MSAGQAERPAINFVRTNCGKKIIGKFIGESRVVTGADGEELLARAAQFGNVRHGADRRPAGANLVLGNFRTHRFPDVDGGEAGGDNISEIAGHVKQSGGTNERFVRSGDAGDAGAEAGTENSERAVTARFEPAKAAAGVANCLAIGLKSKANVWANDVVGTRMAGRGALVVIRQAETKRRNAKAVQPAANVDVRRIVGVPLGEDDNRGTGSARVGREQTSVDAIVFGPRRMDGTGEFQFCRPRGEALRRAQFVIARCFAGEPGVTGNERFRDEFAEKRARLRFVGTTADMLKSPGERQRAAIGLGGPAAMLIAADFLFEVAHRTETANISHARKCAKNR